ncbi:MAG: enoyl-CoA hydratase-related protein [Vicinamibacterales bacterium]
MSEIIFDKKDRVATVTFNRPGVKNALSMAMVQDLIRITRELRDDEDLRVILFRGEGPDLSAGADLKDVKEILTPDPEERRASQISRVRELSQPIFLTMDEIKAPIVVSLRGYAIGVATQLVLAADIVVGSVTAKLSMPNVRLAHAPDHGESYLLPRKVGTSRAMQIALMAETISAETAERYGLINYLTADADLESRTAEIVQRLAASPREAVRQCKALMKGSLNRTYKEQFEAEVDAAGVCAAHPDLPEAINAFLERRPAVFA